MEYINLIISYYFFIFQQYCIHNIQHTCKYITSHRIIHHTTYDRKDITKIIKNYSLYHNIDLYFYVNMLFIYINSYFFNKYIILFQLFLTYLSFYFHSQYHTSNSIWQNFKFFKYLKNKHQIHHIYPRTNYFFIDPTFDILFKTFK